MLTNAMKRTDKWLVAVMLILTTLYQIACTIQGFDLTDEGALMSTYQWFGTEPESAKCGTGYPLSCYLGWAVMSLNPQGGILWVRLCGVAIVTLTEILAFLLLKPFIRVRPLIFGLSVMAVFLAGDPKPLGYNNVAALMFMLTTICVVHGSLRNDIRLLLAGGLLAGINVFVRLPDMSFAVMAAVPFVTNACRPIKANLYKKENWILSVTYIVAMGAGAAIGWACVCQIGADTQLKEFFSSISGQLEGDSSHGLSKMLEKYTTCYIKALLKPLVFATAVIALAKSLSFRNILIKYSLLALTVILLYRQMYDRYDYLGQNIMAMLNGIGLYGCVMYMAKGQREMRAIACGALLFSVLAPLGSDLGFVTMWVGAWLSFPIGLEAALEISEANERISMELQLNYSNGNRTSKTAVRIFTGKYLTKAFWLCTLTILVTTVIKIDHKAYYDPGNRNKKTSSIESPLADNIYTHKYKADIINPMLKELTKHVSPGDELLVYDFCPMINYLTETKPYAGISWPCVYYGQRYVNEVEKEFCKNKAKPVIVLQNFNSSNEWSKINKEYLFGVDAKDFVQARAVKKWLKRYNYRTIWSNGYFEILKPSEK